MSLDTRLWEEPEERLARFLLGALPASEQEEVERRLFTDGAFLEEILAVGDDLIDAYLAGSLTPEDKERFETHFLASPLRRERFEMVRGIVSAAQRRSAARPSGTRLAPWLVAAAAVLVIATFVGIERRGPRGDRTAGPATPTAPPPTMPPATATPVETHLVRLAAEGVRPVEVALAHGTQTLRLEVPIGKGRHPTYNAFVRDIKGAVVWASRGLVPRAAGEPLVLTVPARLLEAADYVLHVEGERRRNPRPADVSLRYTLRVRRP